jgi:hypothetical protein
LAGALRAPLDVLAVDFVLPLSEFDWVAVTISALLDKAG